MGFSFTPENPVLYFGPRHHARWASREFLLWPAWAYRVVAPQIRRRSLNVLQRAVLGLCRAGSFKATGISADLSIHVDLAAFVLRELSDLGYLDKAGCPNARGMKVLVDDAIETHKMLAGYVFQDPWRGDLWPRFVEQLDYCELDYNSNGFPTLVLGTVGRPKRWPAFTVLPKVGVAPAMPSPSSIVEAVSRHRQGLKYSDAVADMEGDLGDHRASGVRISRVSFVEEEPKPVFLATYLYVPEADGEDTDWYACDPFGLGRSVRLRRRIETIMQEMPDLYRVVNRLVGSRLYEGYEDQRRWLDSLELQARLEVERRLTVRIRAEGVFEPLLAMESARQEVRLLGGDCPARKINEVLRAGLKVLEATFATLAGFYPLGEVWKRAYVERMDRRTGRCELAQQRDRSLLAAVYESAIRSVGFEEPVPKPFLNVKAGQLRAVADYGEHWRLRPLVTATALRADQDPLHPLRSIAMHHPRILTEIDEVASVGGKAGHANGPDASAEDAERQVETVYSLVSILLGVGPTNVTDATETDGVPHGEK